MASDETKTLIFKYLALPTDYDPNPMSKPIEFLNLHLSQLPVELLSYFSSVTSPKQRSAVVRIRNRRYTYTNSQKYRDTIAILLSNNPRKAITDKREEEMRWANESFMGGNTKHVGKLHELLGDYEEERQAGIARTERRVQSDNVAPLDEFVAEEDSDSDEGESENEDVGQSSIADDSERLLKEKFISGLSELFNYDEVDFDDSLDTVAVADSEEAWFLDSD